MALNSLYNQLVKKKSRQIPPKDAQMRIGGEEWHQVKEQDRRNSFVNGPGGASKIDGGVPWCVRAADWASAAPSTDVSCKIKLRVWLVYRFISLCGNAPKL